MKQVYTNVNQVVEVTDIIHDCWFELDNVNFDRNSEELRIEFEKENLESAQITNKFLFLKERVTPIHKCFLTICNVKKYVVKDDAKIGRYDFNELNINENTNSILITSGFPLEIHIDVKKFKIEVEITAKVVDKKVSKGL